MIPGRTQSCTFCFILKYFTLLSTFSAAVSFRNRSGFHHLHRGNKPVSRCSILVYSLLHDALHSGYWLSIWYPRRSRHIGRRHENISKSTKGDSHRRYLPDLLPSLHDVCSWSRQLHFRPFWHVQRQFSIADHCFLWMCRSILHIRLKKVRKLNWLCNGYISSSWGVKWRNSLFRFADDIELMTGTRPGLYWLICWKYLSPFAMLAILVASIVEIFTDGSGYPVWNMSKGETERQPWPTWCIVLIVFLISVSVLWIPVVAICR